MRKKKKRALTLLEMMIVILLITMITGVVGYNMSGALERGKVFKSRQAKAQLREMLFMAMTETGHTIVEVADKWETELATLGLAKDVAALSKDGWGEKWKVTKSPTADDFNITSSNSAKY